MKKKFTKKKNKKSYKNRTKNKKSYKKNNLKGAGKKAREARKKREAGESNMSSSGTSEDSRQMVEAVKEHLLKLQEKGEKLYNELMVGQKLYIDTEEQQTEMQEGLDKYITIVREGDNLMMVEEKIKEMNEEKKNLLKELQKPYLALYKHWQKFAREQKDSNPEFSKKIEDVLADKYKILFDNNLTTFEYKNKQFGTLEIELNAIYNQYLERLKALREKNAIKYQEGQAKLIEQQADFDKLMDAQKLIAKKNADELLEQLAAEEEARQERMAKKAAKKSVNEPVTEDTGSEPEDTGSEPEDTGADTEDMGSVTEDIQNPEESNFETIPLIERYHALEKEVRNKETNSVNAMKFFYLKNDNEESRGRRHIHFHVDQRDPEEKKFHTEGGILVNKKLQMTYTYRMPEGKYKNIFELYGGEEKYKTHITNLYEKIVGGRVDRELFGKDSGEKFSKYFNYSRVEDEEDDNIVLHIHILVSDALFGLGKDNKIEEFIDINMDFLEMMSSFLGDYMP